MDRLHERPYYPYSWHQSHDQATVLVMVPYNLHEDDLSVIIDRHHLVITVRGHPPIVKGRLYGSVDLSSSVWQLEPRGGRLSARERTTSSASTTSSTPSSFAFVSSDPDISSSFAASLESGQVSDTDDGGIVSPSPALSSPRIDYTSDENMFQLPPRTRRRPLNPHHHPHRHIQERDHRAQSRSISPGGVGISNGNEPPPTRPSATSSFSSLDSLQSPRSGRLLTVHLEKDQSIIWPSLIVGPAPETLSPNVINSTVFNSSDELEHRYNMDATSLALVALEFSDIRKDKDEAFEFFLRSWHQAHVPSATMRLISHYLSLDATEFLTRPHETPEPSEPPPLRGTLPYWLKCIGGPKGLARLYLEAGLLHLEGAATTLLAASYSSLSSIRVPLQNQVAAGGAGLGAAGSPMSPGAGGLGVTASALSATAESSTEAWRRDREAASRFFERAQKLDPELDIPTLPTEDELELEMPTLQLAPPISGPGSVQSPYDSEPDSNAPPMMVRRRRKQETEGSLFDKAHAGGGHDPEFDEMGNPWYLYIPGIIGAGTALLVVGIVGALSFSTWSRRNQGS